MSVLALYEEQYVAELEAKLEALESEVRRQRMDRDFYQDAFMEAQKYRAELEERLEQVREERDALLALEGGE